MIGAQKGHIEGRWNIEPMKRQNHIAPRIQRLECCEIALLHILEYLLMAELSSWRFTKLSS
jgi:hypothetical protein